MNKFFCAEASRQAGEDIVGSGTNYRTYVLIECHTPWACNALESDQIPQNLKNLIAEVSQSKRSVRFLLITGNRRDTKSGHTLLIYSQQPGEFLDGYRKQEFNLANLEQAALVIQDCLAGKVSKCEQIFSPIRDILVCTHGSHDLCCARFGNPFYNQAVTTVSELGLRDVRLWKSSHFGGHRFAPTAIAFPDGRYYGVLDQPSFKSVLTRSGDIQCFNRVYRGWGMLPTSIQVLERELILLYGWDWFKHRVVSYKLFEHALNHASTHAELIFQKSDDSWINCQASLVKDENKTLRLKGSCGAEKEVEFVKFSVENLSLRLLTDPRETLPLYSTKMAS